MTVQKTYTPKADDIKRHWFVVDAEGQSLGRLATKIASVLRGKHKPIFTPSMDTGDYVIVVNAGKVTVTGTKMVEKTYMRYSGYPGGLTVTQLQHMLQRHPERVLEHAVWGMLPHTKLGRAIIKKLKIYAGPEHPHAVQKPRTLK